MMNVLKHPSFFRPMSRPSSPAPAPSPIPRSEPAIGSDRAPRPINKLSLGTFRRASPAHNMPAPLVQDGTYLEALSLKLSEAVSRTLSQPTGPAAASEQVAGRRPIPQGRGHALGALIASELKSTQENPHLYRAILRSLHRPLSVLLNNLSTRLPPLLGSPTFQNPLVPTVHTPNPNPTQLHALAIATFAGELLETFDDLGLGLDNDLRGDGLKQIREGLLSLVNRVVSPLVAGIKTELMPLIEALEVPQATYPTKSEAKASAKHHPSITTLQAIMPVYARALARYTTPSPCHASLATLLISLVWRGLVAISNRPHVSASPPPSPTLSVPSVKKIRGSPTTTPPLTPPPGRFMIKLPPSRPPSPPISLVSTTAAADAQALLELLDLLPRPAMHRESTQLAREAVDEAFEGLQALAPLLEMVHTLPAHAHLRQPGHEVLARELDQLTNRLPLLIALPILLNAVGGPSTSSVPDMLGLSQDEYRKGCLGGFGRAEECAPAVARCVLLALRADPSTSSLLRTWLEQEIVDMNQSSR
ncbi:hypothetical protein BD779DRAFT_1435385 [Infundibulicybe gibba]|nr:hypothetical protein BD779DRAFT_1435385 [Infundibulicybe gibba]